MIAMWLQLAQDRISRVENSSSAAREVDVPQLRRLVADFPQRRPMFHLSLRHGRRVTGEDSFQVLRFPLPIIIAPTAPCSSVIPGLVH
jgi:hypothetical protein